MRFYPVFRLAKTSFILSLMLKPYASFADAELFGLGHIGNSRESYVTGISADGLFASGSSNIPTLGMSENYEAFRWTPFGIQRLGFLPGESNSNATAISGDGSTVIGFSGNTAFRWNLQEGMQPLKSTSKSPIRTVARGTSFDGSVIVGYSSSDLKTEAFIWTKQSGIQSLGSLVEGLESYAFAVSADGKTVVGQAFTETNLQAFRWTKDSGMQNLGSYSDYRNSQATSVSANGTVIVGQVSDPLNRQQWEAFRWTKSTGMQGLGFLDDDTFSHANSVSGDGKVIVGDSQGGTRRAGGDQGFRWTAKTGMQSIREWLENSGVKLPFTFQAGEAIATNHDGSVVVGNGSNKDGTDRQPYLARAGTGILFDISAFNATLLESATQAPQLSASLANLTLNGSHHRSILDSGLARSTNGLCSWATADAYNQHTSKTRMELVEVGICKDIGKSRFAIGAGMTQGKQDWSMGGSATLTGQYLLAEAATILAGNVQPSVLLYYGTHATEVNRNYLNGTTLVSSIANPDTNSFSARGRLDWKDVAEFAKFRLSPYASVTWSESRMDGYTETGGGFPASYSGVRWHSNDVRAGLAAKRSIAANTDLRLSAEAAHRNDEGGNSKVQVIGLFGFNTGEQSVSQNIYRAIVDIDHRFSDRSLATVSLISSTSEGNTNWGISAGYRAAF